MSFVDLLNLLVMLGAASESTTTYHPYDPSSPDPYTYVDPAPGSGGYDPAAEGYQPDGGRYIENADGTISVMTPDGFACIVTADQVPDANGDIRIVAEMDDPSGRTGSQSATVSQDDWMGEMQFDVRYLMAKLACETAYQHATAMGTAQ